MNSYLHIKKVLGQEKTIELLKRWSQLSCKDEGENKELVEEKNSFIHRPKEGTGNDPIFGERRASIIKQLQNSSNKSQKDLRRNREVPKTRNSRKKLNKIGTDLTHKGKGVSL
ncbi:hypothetical protein O181_001891 [Austropuccinia psidii MF-1]|uniref:Uncharacterized protein n=1 Tax=Austropuccinia psidii MF-1 TaxID=1389203 RepID=A0A9Q3GCU4_9BASI|nr:hypothetical protein [Austropuccinia psidii MF-1]